MAIPAINTTKLKTKANKNNVINIIIKLILALLKHDLSYQDNPFSGIKLTKIKQVWK